MKLVDAHFSIDGKRLTFAFIANGRVDFRSLLKDLVKHFKLNIRLQQIGIRDEIKINGDMGCCGKILCCQSFYKDLGNVTSDLAELQQVAHRGSDRLSGVCGRLKCCLTYERAAYEDCARCLPPIGSQIRTKQGKGTVIGHHTLKKTVNVRLEDNTIL
jgi:cell fate regulator YaaT (PSP1 superfamily)